MFHLFGAKVSFCFNGREKKILQLVEDGLISKLGDSENCKVIKKEDPRFIYSGFLVTGIVENVEIAGNAGIAGNACWK